MTQTELFAHELRKIGGIETEIIPISTKGDKTLDKPLSKIGGKGVFVGEIEKALLDSEIDCAVHSAKDLPVRLAEGLEISGVLKRSDCRDLLLYKKGADINRKGFVIGTGSLRRRMNFRRMFPYSEFAEIRGNVDTRIRKLVSGEYDGIILACAGLERLGIDPQSFGLETKIFSPREFVPAPCQGIIAVETKSGTEAARLAAEISHKETLLRFQTEREVTRLLNADCTVPLGACSFVDSGMITLFVSKSEDKILTGHAELSRRLELAESLVKKL